MSVASGLQLHDIEDVEGFVIGCLKRSKIQFSPDDYEDMLAEGVCLLYDLERKFNGKGRFSGFAAQFLPRRLGDAWHAKNPHHFRAPDETGKRRWQYLEPPISLDGVLEDDAGKPAYRQTRGSQAVEITFRPQTHWAPAKVSVRSQPTASIGA